MISVSLAVWMFNHISRLLDKFHNKALIFEYLLKVVLALLWIILLDTFCSGVLRSTDRNSSQWAGSRYVIFQCFNIFSAFWPKLLTHYSLQSRILIVNCPLGRLSKITTRSAKFLRRCLHLPFYFREHCIFIKILNCPWHA